RIYISLFQVADPEKAMKTIESRAWEIKKELSQRVKHQLRRIPVLHFYRDDTLDYVFKMEEIFKSIAAPENENEDNTPS
ncbi:MAG: ribosome-binding factor A, partial [Chitinophagaceae bacterium]|nr:ribosome-binding factor A [Chitinophagaceae bacterium]